MYLVNFIKSQRLGCTHPCVIKKGGCKKILKDTQAFLAELFNEWTKAQAGLLFQHWLEVASYRWETFLVTVGGTGVFSLFAGKGLEACWYLIELKRLVYIWMQVLTLLTKQIFDRMIFWMYEISWGGFLVSVCQRWQEKICLFLVPKAGFLPQGNGP